MKQQNTQFINSDDSRYSLNFPMEKDLQNNYMGEGNNFINKNDSGYVIPAFIFSRSNEMLNIVDNKPTKNNVLLFNEKLQIQDKCNEKTSYAPIIDSHGSLSRW